MELMIACRSTVAKLQLEHGLAVDRVYTGSFMTSLDMAGPILLLLVSIMCFTNNTLLEFFFSLFACQVFQSPS